MLPASNVSMMIIAEPQHGQGCAGFSIAAALSSACCCYFFVACTGVATAISSRARANVSALVRLRASRP